MANPEHIKILKQGVETWNKWRKENPDVLPDLSDAELIGVNLSHVDLHGANLSCTVFYKADLVNKVFYGTDLSEANLSEANLCASGLIRANLSEANLIGANLSGCELCGANLKGANLTSSNLMLADLRMANLQNADLCVCCLAGTDLSEAILTGAILFGTGRDDWVIKDVECKYVYWEMGRGQGNRCPKDRDLEPGEFERLYSAMPTIEYIFENGMSPLDPLIMDRVVQAIRKRQPGFDIKIDSINARGLAPSIRFTVQHEEYKKPALEEVRNEYEIKLRQFESERDRYYQLLAHALDAPKQFKLINAAPGSIVATDGSTVSVEQHIHNALELQKTIADEPEESESFAKMAKKTALDIVGEAIKDVAKGQVKEAAKQSIKLGKDLGPLFVKMAPAAYEFFKSMGS
jgi:hypothetical protein